MTETEWDGVLSVHLYGAFNMVRNCVPHMIDQKYGRIVLFSSGSGLGRVGTGELQPPQRKAWSDSPARCPRSLRPMA